LRVNENIITLKIIKKTTELLVGQIYTKMQNLRQNQSILK